MKTNLLLICLTMLAFGPVQSQRQSYFFKEIEWNIALHPDFTVINAEDNNQRMKRGADIVEGTNDIKVDLSEIKTLLAATKNKFNYFTATIAPYNEKTDGNYDSLCNAVNEMMVKAFRSKMEDAIIDTSSTTEIVDGIVFSKFIINVKIESKQLFSSAVLHKLYRGYDFGITYLYLDEETRLQMEAMVRESRFVKQQKSGNSNSKNY